MRTISHLYIALFIGCTIFSASAYADKKRPDEPCTEDSECRKGHAETGKQYCENYLAECQNQGLAYTCSPSTYSSKLADVDRYCDREQENICSRWPKDDSKIECRGPEEAMSQVNKCMSAIDSLKK